MRVLFPSTVRKKLRAEIKGKEPDILVHLHSDTRSQTQSRLVSYLTQFTAGDDLRRCALWQGRFAAPLCKMSMEVQRHFSSKVS